MNFKHTKSLPEIQEKIKVLINDSNNKGIIKTNSTEYNYVEIKLNKNFLFYRLDNGRTTSQQKKYIHSNNKDFDFFDNNYIYDNQVQNAQHKILYELAKEQKGFIEQLKNSPQNEAFTINKDGTVINGNRRLSAYRELTNPNVNCQVITDASFEKNDEKRLELHFQYRKEWKKDYYWVNQAKQINDLINADLSIEEIEEETELPEKTITELDQTYHLIVDYLAWKFPEEKHPEYNIDDKSLNLAQQDFKNLYKSLNSRSISDPGDKSDMKKMTWLVISQRDEIKSKYGGRTYNFTSKYSNKEKLNKIKTNLNNEDLNRISGNSNVSDKSKVLENLVDSIIRIDAKENVEKKKNEFHNRIKRIRRDIKNLNPTENSSFLDESIKELKKIIISARNLMDKIEKVKK